MKTLREVELEFKIEKLERQIMLLNNNQYSLGKYDDIKNVPLINSDKNNLFPVAYVLAEKRRNDDGLQVIMQHFGGDYWGMNYFIGESITEDKYHLQQALIDMHEKIIREIAQSRN